MHFVTTALLLLVGGAILAAMIVKLIRVVLDALSQ